MEGDNEEVCSRRKHQILGRLELDPYGPSVEILRERLEYANNFEVEGVEGAVRSVCTRGVV